MLFGIGGYMQVSVQDKVDLIKDYNGHYLPQMIICLGFIYLVINLAGAKIAADNAKPKKRKKLRHVFAGFIYVSVLLCLLILVTSILCFAQIDQLDSAFGTGVSEAMEKYRFNNHMKETIDRLQMQFECCGNEDYTDWFTTAWIDDRYKEKGFENVHVKLKNSQYLNDDVPYSCCTPDAIRPCVHYNVHTNERHYNYDYQKYITLHTTGCKEALMEIYGNQLLTDVGVIILLMAFLQIIVLVCARYLQTSTRMSLKKRAPLDPAIGWLFSFSFKSDPAGASGEEDNLLDDVGDSDDDPGFATDEFDDDSLGSEQEINDHDVISLPPSPAAPPTPPPLPPGSLEYFMPDRRISGSSRANLLAQIESLRRSSGNVGGMNSHQSLGVLH